ncbi:hypothetical protein [Fodinibius roseus]|nr:hypothetical protein [Fodinibius roseus]
MVTIVDYKKHINHNNEEFYSFVLRGELEIVTSKEGNRYATARKATIPTTFDELLCGDFKGKKLPGTIEKVPCEPYDYKLPETGEVITLEHTWEYNPEPVSTEEHVFENGQQEKFPA